MPSVADAGRRAPRRDAAENRESLLTAAVAALAASPDASLETIAAAAGSSLVLRLVTRSSSGDVCNRCTAARRFCTVGLPEDLNRRRPDV